jgi:cytochrome P450
MQPDPRDPAFFNDPYPAYDRLRAQARAFKWEHYGMWCFPRHEDVSALLRDRRFGREVPDRGAIPGHLENFYAFEAHSLLELEPPRHTRLRTLVNRAFVSRAIERLRPRLEALCHDLIDGFAAKQDIELIEAYTTPIPVIMIAELLGVPADMAPQLLAWSHDMVAMYQSRRDRAIEDAAEAATIAFSAFMRGYIAERRGDPRDNLLSTLIAAESDEGKLGEDELITTAILLLNAGHEATVHAMANGMKALLESGHSGPIAPGHVEEVLRFDAPLHLFTRYAKEDVAYAGVNIAKGEEVGLMLAAANRDPARFPHPDRFDPARANNAHVSFGAGIHFCVGAPLARLELEVGLGTLFRRLPHLRLAGTPEYRDTFHFHGLEALGLAW